MVLEFVLFVLSLGLISSLCLCGVGARVIFAILVVSTIATLRGDSIYLVCLIFGGGVLTLVSYVGGLVEASDELPIGVVLIIICLLLYVSLKASMGLYAHGSLLSMSGSVCIIILLGVIFIFYIM